MGRSDLTVFQTALGQSHVCVWGEEAGEGQVRHPHLRALTFSSFLLLS